MICHLLARQTGSGQIQPDHHRCRKVGIVNVRADIGQPSSDRAGGNRSLEVIKICRLKNQSERLPILILRGN